MSGGKDPRTTVMAKDSNVEGQLNPGDGHAVCGISLLIFLFVIVNFLSFFKKALPLYLLT